MSWQLRRPSGPIKCIGCTLLGLIFGLYIFGSVIHVFASARAAAHRNLCISNSKQLGLGMLQYVQDWDQTFPPAAQWATLIHKHAPREETWHCAEATSPFSYAMNHTAGGVRLEDVDSPIDTVLLFEMDAPVQNAWGGPQDVVNTTRHYGANIYELMDGHAKRVNAGMVRDLNWQARRPSSIK